MQYVISPLLHHVSIEKVHVTPLQVFQPFGWELGFHPVKAVKDIRPTQALGEKQGYLRWGNLRGIQIAQSFVKEVTCLWADASKDLPCVPWHDRIL